VVTDPNDAHLTLDGAPAGQGALTRELVLDGTEHTLRASAPGFQTATVIFRDEPPPRLLRLERVVEEPPPVSRRRKSPAPVASGKPRPPATTPTPAVTAPPKPTTKLGANQAPIIKD
jgi:hypothetical protein